MVTWVTHILQAQMRLSFHKVFPSHILQIPHQESMALKIHHDVLIAGKTKQEPPHNPIA